MGKLASVGSEKREEKRRMRGCKDADTENVSDTAEDKGGELSAYPAAFRSLGRSDRRTC